MSELVPQSNTQTTPAFSPEEISILKQQIMKGATDQELALFGKVCAQTGLSPFARQIFAVPRIVYNKETKMKEQVFSFQTSVDGFRLVASRSNEYEGQTPAQWCDEDGIWTDVWLKKHPPFAARVGVYRKKFREPLYAVARWDSYAQMYEDYKTGKLLPNAMWGKMPDLMLAKCAECLALRKAFPQELSGLYSQEEMDQSQEVKTTEETKADTKSDIKELPKPSDTPSPIKPAASKPIASTIVPEASPRPNPDEEFTSGFKKGTKIKDLAYEELEEWAVSANTWMLGKEIDPMTSFMDMARTYRAVKRRMLEIQPSMFDSAPTGVLKDGDNEL